VGVPAYVEIRYVERSARRDEPSHTATDSV
jgi:hypothetical protein